VDEYKDNFFKIYESNIARKAPIWPDLEIMNMLIYARQKDQAIAYFDYFNPPTAVKLVVSLQVRKLITHLTMETFTSLRWIHTS